MVRELAAEIAACDLPVGYADLLWAGLAREGKVLSPSPTTRWPLLVLAACEVASGGRWEHATPAAAAVEAVIVAFDLLDDLQDGEIDPTDLGGPAQALGVCAGLQALAQRLLLRLLDRGVDPATVCAVGAELARAVATAGGGQYLDLLAESRPTGTAVTEAEALDVAARKAGALAAGACRLGARLGTAEANRVDRLGQFGWHLGMTAQLLNDLAAVAPGHGQKSDLRRGKKTLPLVVAATFGLDLAGALAAGGEAGAKEALVRSGALHYTWVVADMHRQQAISLLAGLGPGVRSESLLSLLPTV